MLRFRHALLLFPSLASVVFAADEGETLHLPDDELNIIIRQTPMPELGEGRLARILERYYKEGLGGPENWERIESLNVAGTLTLEDGEFELNAYQKKPDLMKMSIRRPPNPESLVLAYDGEVAWQQLGIGAEAEPMGAAEARRFIHSSRFGNHLLYPFEEGKTIRYVDTVPVEGAICHQIRVTLDTEYQVDYFIEIRSYLEIKVENTDLQSGARNSVVYKDYIREFGVPIAKKADSFENGEWVSTLVLDEVKLNSGVMPWMFTMPE